MGIKDELNQSISSGDSKDITPSITVQVDKSGKATATYNEKPNNIATQGSTSSTKALSATVYSSTNLHSTHAKMLKRCCTLILVGLPLMVVICFFLSDNVTDLTYESVFGKYVDGQVTHVDDKLGAQMNHLSFATKVVIGIPSAIVGIGGPLLLIALLGWSRVLLEIKDDLLVEAGKKLYMSRKSIYITIIMLPIWGMCFFNFWGYAMGPIILVIAYIAITFRVIKLSFSVRCVCSSYLSNKK